MGRPRVRRQAGEPWALTVKPRSGYSRDNAPYDSNISPGAPLGRCNMDTSQLKLPPTLQWSGGIDGRLVLIDQTLLPLELRQIECHDAESVWEAIRSLRVRGAPAIGIAAAYGVCVGLQTAATADEARFFVRLDEVTSYLATSRPTAVNLFWALDRIRQRAETLRGNAAPAAILAALLA